MRCLKCKILHIKQNQEYSKNYIIKSPVYLRKITFKSVTICIVICYFVILQFCQFDILKIQHFVIRGEKILIEIKNLLKV